MIVLYDFWREWGVRMLSILDGATKMAFFECYRQEFILSNSDQQTNQYHSIITQYQASPYKHLLTFIDQSQSFPLPYPLQARPLCPCPQQATVNKYIMECCSGGADPKDDPFRTTIKQDRAPQPLKFSLLSAIGLKDYLIEKYVFSRREPTYEIVDEDGRKVFRCQGGVEYPWEYKTEATFIEDERHSIPAVILSLKDRSKYSGTIIYSHGNSSDLKGSLRFICAFAGQLPKFDFLVYDYTGYGRSNKRETTEQSIIEDLQLVIKTIRVPHEQIILWGFSLGAYPTVRVGKEKPFRGMILQSPLASVYSLFAQQLTPYSTFEKDCFSLLDHIPSVDCFLVIAHSRTDETIPFSHGKTLFQRYQMINSNPFCFLLQVDGLAHNQMHPLLCSANKNEVRESFHNYLKLMAEQGQLPKARIFQLQKNKYFGNLGDMQSAEKIDVTDKNTFDETAKAPPTPQLGQQHSLADLKGENVFEIDDIGEQEVIELNHYMKVKAEEHRDYFQSSQEAKDETEVESIPSEQMIPDILS